MINCPPSFSKVTPSILRRLALRVPAVINSACMEPAVIVPMSADMADKLVTLILSALIALSLTLSVVTALFFSCPVSTPPLFIMSFPAPSDDSVTPSILRRAVLSVPPEIMPACIDPAVMVPRSADIAAKFVTLISLAVTESVAMAAVVTEFAKRLLAVMNSKSPMPTVMKSAVNNDVRSWPITPSSAKRLDTFISDAVRVPATMSPANMERAWIWSLVMVPAAISVAVIVFAKI